MQITCSKYIFVKHYSSYFGNIINYFFYEYACFVVATLPFFKETHFLRFLAWGPPNFENDPPLWDTGGPRDP